MTIKISFFLSVFLSALLLFGTGCIKVESPLKVYDVNPSGGEAFRARSNISGTIQVKLMNEFGEAIANKSAKIESENGIRCIKAPCPTEYIKWTGTLDAQGFVAIPAKVINVFTTITVDGYSAKDLNKDSQKITDHEWQIIL